MINEHPDYITVTGPALSGFYAVHCKWYDERGGFYDAYQTGVGRYATVEEAIEEGKAWALADEIEFRGIH